jgi:membrane protein implicated in regulation of membrane protease activity
MIGIAIALIVMGVLFGFFLPFGWVVGIVGLVLAVVYFAGFGRRASRGEHPTQPGP